MNLLLISYFLSLFFILIIFVQHGTALHKNNCSPSKCSRHGPSVRFPFRTKACKLTTVDILKQGLNFLAQKAKQQCLSFQIQLNYWSTRLIMQINLFVQLILKTASQDSFEISIYQLLRSDFPTKGQKVRSCSTVQGQLIIPFCPLPRCSYNIVNIFSSSVRIDNMNLMYCTKMCDVSLPDSMIFNNDYDLHLNPSCESCATQGKYCGLKANNTRLETECLGKINHFSWISAKVLATGTVLGLILIVLAGFVFYRIYSFDKIEKAYQLKIEKFLSDYKAFKPARYSYSDIKRITNEFREELGQGAYGTVFKGKLSDQILVAVKVLNNSKGDGEEFVNEVRLIGRIHHVNVVRLIGFCADGFRRALIYEYLSNDSLEKYISSADSKTYFLGWKRMKDIVIGSAKGIEYLHQGCNQRIIHFDIKPNNILLDNNFNPKISDFGLAKLCSKDQSAVSMTTARGTIGYIAPEVFSRNFGNVSYK